MVTKQNNAAAVAEVVPNGTVPHAAGTDERTSGADSAALLEKLAAEFPRSQVSWRAQSVSNKDPNEPKALALAYIDARDVMDRLNEVCGVNWQCRYPHADKKTICEIGIKFDGEWIWRANGAGDSDIEAEKGAISDAFKRAAVNWGIGRYLYDIESPWVPCELYNGKWNKWAGDPWDFVRGSRPAPKVPEKPAEPTTQQQESHKKWAKAINDAPTYAELKKLTDAPQYRNVLTKLDGTEFKVALMNLVTTRLVELETKEAA